jgi:uncharacterized protein (UPF0276 family)
MPLPFTEEISNYIVNRIKKVQDILGRRILLENVSSYLSFKSSEMTEWEFLSLIATKADCGLLLDVNNVYVSSVNHGYDPVQFIHGLPLDRIGQIHLAGHSVEESPSGRKFLIDTHDHPVCPEVWELYQVALERFGLVSTMIEWDANIPEYDLLEAEIDKARHIQEQFDGKQQASRKPYQISNRVSIPSQEL